MSNAHGRLILATGIYHQLDHCRACELTQSYMVPTLRKTLSSHPLGSTIQAASLHNRIVGYDLARAGAFFGMLLVNFSVILGGAGSSSANWFDWFTEIIRGRPAATFVVLAGAGLSLMTRDACRRKDRKEINRKCSSLLKRSLFLLVIGLFNFFISPISDILHFYAFYLAFGACLLTFSSSSLWLVTAAAVICRPLVFVIFGFIKTWDLNPSAGGGFWNLPGIIGHILFNGCFPLVPWMAFITVGMWLGRQDFSDRFLRKRILLAGVGAVAFAESLSRVAMYLSSSLPLGPNLEELLPLFRIVPWDPMPLFVISATGTALVVIALIMQLADKYGNSPWVLPFVSVGQTTLTLYVTHIITGTILLWILEAFDLAPRLFSLWASLSFFLVALFFSQKWLNHFRKGPLETLMRRYFSFSSATTTAVEVKAPL